MVVEGPTGIASHRDRQAVGIKALVLEGAEVIPATEFYGPGQARLLIVFVRTLGHQQRRGVKAEVKPVIVAHLRVADAVGARGITVEHRDHEAQLVVRTERHANAWRGERIGRAAAWQVGDRDCGPAPGRIQEVAAAFGDNEILIGCKLTKLDREAVVEHVLLEPELGEARCGGGLEITHQHQATDIVGGNALPMDLVGIGVEAEALPEPHLLHVAIEMELEHTVIGDALLDTAGWVAECLANIKAAQTEAALCQSLTDAGGVDRGHGIFGDARVRDTAIRACPGGQRQCGHRQYDQKGSNRRPNLPFAHALPPIALSRRTARVGGGRDAITFDFRDERRRRFAATSFRWTTQVDRT